MPTRHRRSTSRNRGNRRKLVWATKRTTGSVVAANNQTTNIDMLSDYKAIAGASTAGITIMRTHLQIFVSSTVTNGDSFVWGMKIDDVNQVVTSSAAAANINPSVTVDTDWMILHSEAALPTYGFGVNVIDRDLKSKRRMEEVQEAYLLCVAPLGVAAGGLPFTYSVFSRILLAMP